MPAACCLARFVFLRHASLQKVAHGFAATNVAEHCPHSRTIGATRSLPTRSLAARHGSQIRTLSPLVAYTPTETAPHPGHVLTQLHRPRFWQFCARDTTRRFWRRLSSALRLM